MTIAIVLYDGECQFCNKWVCFVKSKLQKNKISFLPLGSSKAIDMLEDYKIVNQKTGRKVNINGKIGKEILRNY